FLASPRLKTRPRSSGPTLLPDKTVAPHVSRFSAHFDFRPGGGRMGMNNRARIFRIFSRPEVNVFWIYGRPEVDVFSIIGGRPTVGAFGISWFPTIRIRHTAGSQAGNGDQNNEHFHIFSVVQSRIDLNWGLDLTICLINPVADSRM